MADYRRITRQCCKDDWRCSVHDDVVARHRTTDILKQFFSQDPRTWFTESALRERRRDVKKGQQAPSKRPIGSLKTAGQRAWVWKDDGSGFDIHGGFAGFELHWMIAYGNRRQGHRSDLQEKRKALLEDDQDTWRPAEPDYEDLLASHDDGFTQRAVEAIRHAVGRAQAQHNTVIEIASPEIRGHVLDEHDEDLVEGVVVEEINERWVLLAKHRTNGRPLLYADAQNLAAQAYPAELFPETVSEPYSIRGGLLQADPATHYIFYSPL